MPDPARDPVDWRPQAFGSRSFRQVHDPVVEPLWSGVRVLAHVSTGEVALLDDNGVAHAQPAVEVELAAALLADSAILDGYLTDEAAGGGEGVEVGAGVRAPTVGQVARQMIVGGGTRDRRRDMTETLERRRAGSTAGERPLVFVAVDLVALDGESLLDVPLLERKRLLDSVLEERALVRRGIHVRPPVDTWLSTWRAIGFRGLAYKDANSRYHPGERNDGWATAPMPHR